MDEDLYDNFDRNLYKKDFSGYSTGLPTNDDGSTVDISDISSGGSVNQQNQYVGAFVAGKQGFTNNESGYILGVDKGIPKFYIGNSSNYLNWDGTTLSVSGSITLTSGTIAGLTISATALTAVSGGNTTILSSGATAFSAGPTGSPSVTITQAGILTATSAVISGSITATTGAIGGFTIGADFLKDAADSFGLASTVTGGDDVRFWAGSTFASRATAPFRVTEAGAIVGSNVTITGGAVSGVPISGIPNSTATDISLLEFTHNLAFTSASATQVNWASGTINLSNGRTFSISSGNTSTMAALTYIYLDTGASTTVLQITTTYSTAIGANKLLVAVAKNNTVTASAIVYGGSQPLVDGSQIGALSIVAGNIAALTITAAQIAANTITAAKITAGTITTTEIAALTITAGNIAASTITAAKLSVSQLSAIAADLGTITAGVINLSTSGNIHSGQTAYNTGTGWWWEYNSGTPRFSVGNPATYYMTWDGTTLTVKGTVPDVQTFTANGTWTKPAGAKFVRVVCIGAGGGGAGGDFQNGAPHTSGAGGGGAVTEQVFDASLLGSTETITIGTGGTAGTHVVNTFANGGAGGDGSSSSFGTWMQAGGGGGGTASSSPTGGAGGGGFTSAAGFNPGLPSATVNTNAIGSQSPNVTTTPAKNGEYGGGTGTPNSNSAGGSSIYGAGGGGGGGDNIKASDGGTVGAYTVGGGGAQGTCANPGTVGTDGSSNATLKKGYGGAGGGGGGGNNSSNGSNVVAGNGGAGGIPGGGGGGGGCCFTNTGSGTTGTGGAGARGQVIVYTT